MAFPLSVALLAVALGGCGGESAPTENFFGDRHTSWRRARVVVADADMGRLSVFDVEDDEVIAMLDIPAPVRVSATHTGNHALLQGPRGLAFLAAGVAIVDHVDHIHIYKAQPRLRNHVLDGAAPPGLVSSHDGWVVAYFAGASSGFGKAIALKEDDLMASGAPLPRNWEGHAGGALVAAFPFAGALLGVRQNSSGAGELVVVERDGEEPRSLLACSDPGDPVVAGARAAVPCREGVVVVVVEAEGAGTATSSRYRATLVRYPGAVRARVLRAHPGSDVLVGDQGPRAFLRIDGSFAALSARELRADLPSDTCEFDLEPKDAGRVVTLSADGKVRSFTLEGADLRTSKAGIPGFSCDGAAVRPRMALAPERAYVTDPGRAALLDFDLRTVALARQHSIGGRPASIAVVGVDLRNANVAPGAEHGPDEATGDGGATDGADGGDAAVGPDAI